MKIKVEAALVGSFKNQGVKIRIEDRLYIATLSGNSLQVLSGVTSHINKDGIEEVVSSEYHFQKLL